MAGHPEFDFMVRMIMKGLGMATTASSKWARKQWERPPAQDTVQPQIEEMITVRQAAHFVAIIEANTVLGMYRNQKPAELHKFNAEYLAPYLVVIPESGNKLKALPPEVQQQFIEHQIKIYTRNIKHFIS